MNKLRELFKVVYLTALTEVIPDPASVSQADIHKYELSLLYKFHLSAAIREYTQIRCRTSKSIELTTDQLIPFDSCNTINIIMWIDRLK